MLCLLLPIEAFLNAHYAIAFILLGIAVCLFPRMLDSNPCPWSHNDISSLFIGRIGIACKRHAWTFAYGDT